MTSLYIFVAYSKDFVLEHKLAFKSSFISYKIFYTPFCLFTCSKLYDFLYGVTLLSQLYFGVYLVVEEVAEQHT